MLMLIYNYKHGCVNARIVLSFLIDAIITA